jgi:hypothetical protein
VTADALVYMDEWPVSYLFVWASVTADAVEYGDELEPDERLSDP